MSIVFMDGLLSLKLMRTKKQSRIFLAILIFAIALSTKIIPSFFESLTSDSCIYLNIAQNLAGGRGFNCSYNLYQFWSGQYYPAYVLFPPIFPLLGAVVWKIFHSISAVALLNAFLAGCNGVLLFYLLNIVYEDRCKYFEIPFWATIIVSVSSPMQHTSMYAWTEQSSLICLLLIAFLFMRLKGNVFLPSVFVKIGLLFGLGFLVRFDLIFCFLAALFFVLLQYGLNRFGLRGCLYMVVGLSIIMLPYELFCIVKYGIIYPAYPKVNTVGFTKAILLGGYYDVSSLPVLKAYPVSARDLVALLQKIPVPFSLFLNALVKDINFLIIFLAVRAYVIARRNDIRERFLLVVGAASFFIHTLFLAYQPVYNYFDVIRFSLVHFVFFIPLAVAGFYEAVQQYYVKRRSLVYHLGIIIALFFAGQFLWRIHKDYFTESKSEVFRDRAAREDFLKWVKEKTPQDGIVAIAGALMQRAVTLDRPIVSVPERALLTAKNMRDFLLIYKPLFIIAQSDDCEAYHPIISSYAYEVGSQEKWHHNFRVFALNYAALSLK